MKTILIFILIAAVLVVGFFWLNDSDNAQLTATSTATTTQNQNAQNNRDTEASPVAVRPISHATMALAWSGATIITDPVGETTMFQGMIPDVILITDIHGDHLSSSTLAAIMGSSTVIVPQAVKDALPENIKNRTTVLANGQSTTSHQFRIEAVPMYNVPEAQDSRHVKGRGNGYIIEREGYRVYVAGDTGNTNELRSLRNIDMAFIPMNLPFTMSVEDAASAVVAFKPKQVYPYHYRQQDGFADVNKFKQLVDAANIDTDVVLLNWYPE
ncbi:MAG TPA: MBL fold metallo-hydrolase [Candidatus Paceibacterota bacterium]